MSHIVGLTTRNDALARGFDAGNYANAYTSEDLDTAWEVVEDGEHLDEYRTADSDAFRAAFVLGFFASYEHDEISFEYVDEYDDALSTYGAVLRELGIAVGDDDDQHEGDDDECEVS